MYWIFVCALALNAVYPAVLLHSKHRGLQRDATSAIDVLLDMTYFLTFWLSMYAAYAWPKMLSTTFLDYTATLSPLVRLVTTAREIEVAAVVRLEQRQKEATSKG
jgi:hypothetical protein